MCSGKDIVTAAAVVATVYTGGAAAGLWGAAEAGAVGASGAIAGSEAFASGVGAAGGDAIGSLIASNAANWGMSVAPEIAALGGSAAELAAISASTAATGGEAGAAAGAGAGSGASVGGALTTAAKFAPLASLAMVGMQPKLSAVSPSGAIAPPAPPPAGQASQTPEQSIFKKALRGAGDPTMLTGSGGVSSMSLGKATVLGS